MKRLTSILNKQTVVRARELYRSGIHPQELSRALERGLLSKIGRGLYARAGYPGYPADIERQIVLACKRVPTGVVCLESAAKYHGLFPFESDSIWMAIDFKAKKPVVNRLQLRFVRFSGKALTQGVVNTKIDGVPVRIYSAAKTIADCLKYRRKMGRDLAARIMRESIVGRKCSEQRLRHFAKMCRVYKLVQVAYSSVDSSVVS
jgi:predicted transcriptional regulator of viral defense system